VAPAPREVNGSSSSLGSGLEPLRHRGAAADSRTQGANVLLSVLIVLIVLFLLFGGIGYGYRDRMGSYYGGGTSLLGLLVVIFIILVLLGAIHI
jgi:hypothetical protein